VLSLGVEFNKTAAIVGLVLALANGLLWHQYRGVSARAGIPPQARAVIERWSLPLHLLGHYLPALLFGLALLNIVPVMATAVAASLGLAGGIFWKILIITRASYQQGFALARYPQRGSGSRSAPARLQGYGR